jgi:MFS family permease
MGPEHLACALFFFLQGLCASTWAARIPTIAQELNLGDVALGSVLVCAPLASLAAMPVAGLLVARYGSRPVLRVSALYQALGVVAIGWAPTPWALGAALLAYGVANTLVQIAVNAQAVATERRTGGSWMATYHGLWSIGGFAGAALAAGLMARQMGPKGHVTVMLVGVLALYAWGYHKLLPDAPDPSTCVKAWAKPDGQLLVLGALAFLAMFCETAMFDWSGMYLGRVVQLPAHMAGTAYAAMMAAMAIGRFGADVAVGRLGLLSALRWGGALSVLGLGLAVLWPQAVPASFGFTLVGLGLAPLVPLLMGAAGRATALPPGVALAWTSTIGFTGAMAAPPTLGWLSAHWGLRIAFALPVMLATLFVLGLSGRPLARRNMANPSAIG